MSEEKGKSLADLQEKILARAHSSMDDGDLERACTCAVMLYRLNGFVSAGPLDLGISSEDLKELRAP
jgi:hypothetical protein